jgi:uncharacterized protein YbaR (Trm112 family)
MTAPDERTGSGPPIDDALLAVVRCPVTGERLERRGDELRTASGRSYRIVDGLAVLVPGPRSARQATGADSAGIS